MSLLRTFHLPMTIGAVKAAIAAARGDLALL